MVTYHIGVEIHQNIVICVCTCVRINYSFGVKVIVNVLALLLLCDVFWAQFPVLSLMHCSACDLLFIEVCILENQAVYVCHWCQCSSCTRVHLGNSECLLASNVESLYACVCVCVYVCICVCMCSRDTQWLKGISVWLLKTILHVCFHCL